MLGLQLGIIYVKCHAGPPAGHFFMALRIFLESSQIVGNMQIPLESKPKICVCKLCLKLTTYSLKKLPTLNVKYGQCTSQNCIIVMLDMHDVPTSSSSCPFNIIYITVTCLNCITIIDATLLISTCLFNDEDPPECSTCQCMKTSI